MKKLNRPAAFIICIILILSAVVPTSAIGGSAPEERFDKKLGMYMETFAGGRQFVSTAPNNGRTYDAVILDLPSGITATLRCDGSTVPLADKEPIYKAGYYTLSITAPDVVSGESTETLFVFRIQGTPVRGSVFNKKYNCPEFACAPVVSSDDESMGMYAYVFPNHKRFYSSVSEDEKEVEQAIFYFPPNVGYELYKNGQPITVPKNMTVTQPGSYQLNVYAKNYGSAVDYAVVYKAVHSFVIPAPEVLLPTAQPGGALAASGIGAISTPQTATQTAPQTAAAAETAAERDSLTETYNEDANIYKEEFSSGDAFYTNTSNSDICGGNVYIDIPANMTVEMTKDGMVMPYTNKTYLDSSGSYQLNITDNFGGKKLIAKYSFRIQPGLDASGIPKEEESEEGEESNISEIFSDGDVSSVEGADYGYDIERNRFVYPLGQDKIYLSVPPGMFSNSGLAIELPYGAEAYAKNENDEEYPLDEGSIKENGTYTVSVSGAGGESAELTFYLYNRAVNMPEQYEAPKGYLITAVEYTDYKNTYGLSDNEDEETTGVFDVSDEELSADEETDENADENSEENEEEAEENARLREEYEKGLDIIDGFSDRAASGGIPDIMLPIDGSYVITMEGEEGLPVLTCEIRVDRTVPVVTFDGLNKKNVSTGNEFTLNCFDDDVTLILYKGRKDGEVLSDTGGSFTIRGVDKYTIVARDAAGNESSYDVRIARHIGAAGVGAIVMLIILLAAVVGFIVYNSKRFSVR